MTVWGRCQYGSQVALKGIMVLAHLVFWWPETIRNGIAVVVTRRSYYQLWPLSIWISFSIFISFGCSPHRLFFFFFFYTLSCKPPQDSTCWWSSPDKNREVYLITNRLIVIQSTILQDTPICISLWFALSRPLTWDQFVFRHGTRSCWPQQHDSQGLVA